MFTQLELEAASALKRIPAILERIAIALEKKEQPQPKSKEEATPKWKGWVSVKDSLPEIGLRVIVMVPWHGENLMFKSYRVSDKEKGSYSDFDIDIDRNNFLVDQGDVAWWMRIPPLPNGGK